MMVVGSTALKYLSLYGFYLDYLKEIGAYFLFYHEYQLEERPSDKLPEIIHLE